MTARAKYGSLPRPAPGPAVPRSSIGLMRDDRGVETIWIRGASGRRMIEGIATTPTVNSHKYSVASAGCTIRLPVPLLSSHVHRGAVGQVVWAQRSAERILIRAVIGEGPAGDAAWRLIQDGTLRALSSAADNASLVTDGVVEGVEYYRAWRLLEVSLCQTGANPDCHCWPYDGGPCP